MPPETKPDLPPERRRDAVNRSDLEAFRSQTFQHFDERFDQLERLIRSGFPDGNPEKHREVHEGYIAEARDRRAMWIGLRDHMLKGVGWGALTMFLLAVWEYIKAEVKK